MHESRCRFLPAYSSYNQVKEFLLLVFCFLENSEELFLNLEACVPSPSDEPHLTLKNVSPPGLIQYLQFGYQKGVLYRLKALGERHDMDITIEGFHSWMWKGLSFLLPFLFAGYFFQAYNSYVLYKLSRVVDAPWQVSFLSLLFLTLFVGNTFTTLVVVPQKLRGKIKESYRLKSVSWAMKIRQQIKVNNGFRCPSSSS